MIQGKFNNFKIKVWARCRRTIRNSVTPQNGNAEPLSTTRQEGGRQRVAVAS
jgi:hypothetical protein